MVGGRRRFLNGKRVAETSIPSWKPRQPAQASVQVVPAGFGWNEQCLVAWRADMERRELAKPTIRSYDSSLRYFLDWLAVRRMSVIDVGSRELLEYLDELRADDAQANLGTINSRFTAISSLYDYLAHERIIPDNFVPSFRYRYVRRPLLEHNKRRIEKRLYLSVAQMRRLVQSLSDVQERAVVVLSAKTGARVSEIVAIDIADIDWKGQSIRLKKHPKRTNLWVLFDEETARLLRKWIAVRAHWTDDSAGPLFLSPKNNARLTNSAVGHFVRRAASRIGLHKADGEKHERLSHHAFRHWFTTHLKRAGMPTEYVQVLRGDSVRQTHELYTYIDFKDIRREYIKRVPIIVGQRKNPAEIRREKRAQNPSFGFLTADEAARTHNHQPREKLLELRRRLAHDLQRGKLRRPAHYVDWLVVEKGMKLTTARPIVSHQLRLLGVPPLHRGARTKDGWRKAQKELKAQFTGKKGKRGRMEKRGRV